MDTMISFSDNSLSDTFLTKDELRKACPTAFKTEPTNPRVSGRYVHANTETVIDDLGKLGWRPVQAKQCRTRKGSSGIRSFHMVAFQNPDVKIVKRGEDESETVDTWPRIILTNSHDGFNSFRFMLGMYRLVCSNGLVVGDTELLDMSIRHVNYDFETLRDVVKTAIERIPAVVCQMNEMRGTILTEEMKKELAISVVRLRRGEENGAMEIGNDTIRDILGVVRGEDKSDDLWTVFNVCQEKMMRGGYSDHRGRKLHRQRGITSIKRDMELNRKLWNVATGFIRRREAA